MVSYFGEQLAEQSSRGVRNTVTDVRLDKGDLSEAWSEGGREYATVAMRFSMIDVTRDSSGRVVDGDPAQRTTGHRTMDFRACARRALAAVGDPAGPLATTSSEYTRAAQQSERPFLRQSRDGLGQDAASLKSSRATS